MAWGDRDEQTWECAADLVKNWGWGRLSLLQRLYDSLKGACLREREMDQVR